MLGMEIVWYGMVELQNARGREVEEEASRLGWGLIMKGLLCHVKEFVLCFLGNGEPWKDFKSDFKIRLDFN